MPNKYIYKGGDLDVTQAASRAAVVHFTKDGLLKASQDGKTQQAISLDDVELISGNRTATPAESGKTFVAGATGFNVTLPAASKGKMRFRASASVDVTSNSLIFTPASTDKFVGNRLSKSAGQTLSLGNAADAAGDFVEIVSDGTTNWYIVAAKGTWA